MHADIIIGNVQKLCVAELKWYPIIILDEMYSRYTVLTCKTSDKPL